MALHVVNYNVPVTDGVWDTGNQKFIKTPILPKKVNNFRICIPLPADKTVESVETASPDNENEFNDEFKWEIKKGNLYIDAKELFIYRIFKIVFIQSSNSK